MVAKKLKKQVVLTALMAATTGMMLSSPVFAMSPFQATYQFQYNGKNMGTATRALSKSGNQWTYVFKAKAGGIASATETSKFTLNGSQIQSKNFSRSSKILVHNNTMSLHFDANKNIINTKKDDKSRSFAFKSGVLDELNAELQLREDLKKGGLKSAYFIADAKEVEQRKFVKQGNEKIQAGNTSYDTVKVVMKHDKPGRETIFWLAPKLDYAPVKVSHVDKKSSYGLLLTQYSAKMP